MEPFLGQIQAFGFNFAPIGWALCQGQLLSIAQNTALFSLLGTTFGGDGETTFGLPDLRGRSMVGVGTGPGLDTITWGEWGGSHATTLSIANMPSHNHNITNLGMSNADGEESTPVGHNIAAHTDAFNEDTTTPIAVSNAGGGSSFGIRDPFLGVYISIALQGVYPSRN